MKWCGMVWRIGWDQSGKGGDRRGGEWVGRDRRGLEWAGKGQGFRVGGEGTGG